MASKENLEAYLRENRVPYQTHHHPVAYTAQELAAAEHLPGKMVAKSVIVSAGGRFSMLVLPAVAQVDLQLAATVIGAADARLATEREFADTFPDCELGAIPPFGNLYDLPVFVDRSLADDESITFPAGTHSDSITLKYADFQRLAEPKLADFRRLARA